MVLLKTKLILHSDSVNEATVLSRFGAQVVNDESSTKAKEKYMPPKTLKLLMKTFFAS